MSRRNQPVELTPLNPKKRERQPAPTGNEQHPMVQGFSRLSSADPRTGARPPIGGRPVYPPYREDC